jgi:hypothetical protein
MNTNLKNLPLTKNNFLRFYPLTSGIGASRYSNSLYNSHLYRWRNKCAPLPILVGDILTFYTNFDNGSPLQDGDVFRIVENENTIITTATDVELETEQVGLSNHKITITVPFSTTKPNGYIRVAVVTSLGVIRYISNPFQIRPYEEKYINNTHLLTFKHNNDIYGYEWSALSDDEYYTLRIEASVKGISYPADEAVYKSATSGRPRKTRSVLDKAFSFGTYYNDEDFHDAFNMAVSLRQVFVNGNKVVKDGAYELEYNQIFNLNKGTVSLLDEGYSMRINRCEEFIPLPEPLPDPVIDWSLTETSGDEVFIDANMRIFVNEEVELTAFGNSSGTFTTDDLAEIRIQWFYLEAAGMDEGLTKPSLRLIVIQDFEVIINKIVEIAIPSVDLTLNDTFIALSGSEYTISVSSFEDLST